MIKFLFLVTFLCGAADAAPTKLVSIPAGGYTSFFKSKDGNSSQIKVQPFQMEETAVTNEQFLNFVRAYPEWRKSKIKRIFADEHYLQKWTSDLKLQNPKEINSPVVYVSWFAAQAYCESLNRTLPTVDQWEYAAAPNSKIDPQTNQKILDWYSHPNPTTLPAVKKTGKNHFGLFDLYGLVWEWTLDFNSTSQSSESREGSKNENLFCGSGSIGSSDPTNYASFMRYSFRNSLKANYSIGNLGFRCIKETK